MAATSFTQRITRAPAVFDARAAAIAWERLEGLGGEASEAVATFKAHAALEQLVTGTVSNSPFLTRLLLQEAAWLADALAVSPEEVLHRLMADMARDAAVAETRQAVMSALRIARARAALLIALADLGGVFDLWAVTESLTRLADAALGGALDWILKDAARRGQLAPTDPGNPAKGSGLIILAMGKGGAFELNYSSDIDLIVFYDAERMPVVGIDPATAAVRFTQSLVQFLQQRTGDGYVFRVDLRLRPDGNASPVAISAESAELYYESAGQNWERAAMIKARPCAGDIEAGEALLKSLSPFVWRKNLDFAAIEDIHSIKRQIHAHRGHGEIAVAGHNLKLGRGGIREIEFFAQTQQLILGGREPDLRVRATREALEWLATRGHIAPDTKDALLESYVFLRTLEHRLQMIEDEQTHTLPSAKEGLDHVARFAGYNDTSRFESDLLHHLQRVQGHYARLFETSETLAAETGSLVFTGVEEDPETVETLTRLGFRRAEEVSAIIRGWHHGRVRATRSERARERLTLLVPILIHTLSKTGDPDAAFYEFAHFVEAVPTGVQLFSLLASNPELLKFLTEVFAMAPRLARVLAERPAILDGLLTPGFLEPEPASAKPEKALQDAFARARGLEEKLDEARIFARERQFRTALRVLKAGLGPVEAGHAFAETAQDVVQALARVCEEETERRHGRIEGGEWCVVALGKLGGCEMTATSDLDLIFVYAFDPDCPQSTGASSVHASQYYARMSQRLISLLTVPTREGKLYEVDMRLRPSGRAGPVAVTLDRLRTYHETEAWTYELMSLTRARVVYGAPGLGAKVESAVHAILTAPRDLTQLSADALKMRARLEGAKPVRDPWSIKLVRGGLMDLDYIAQILELALGCRAQDLLRPATREVFAALGRLGLVPAADAEALTACWRTLAGVSQVMRVSAEAEARPERPDRSLEQRLAEAAGAPAFSGVEPRLIETEARVRALFDKYVRDLQAQFSR